MGKKPWMVSMKNFANAWDFKTVVMWHGLTRNDKQRSFYALNFW